MSDSPDDRQLRDRFQQLKADDAKRAPDFATMYQRAYQASEANETIETRRVIPIAGRRRWVLAAGTAMAAAIAGLTLLPTNDDHQFEELVTAFSSEMEVGLWKSPTDGLLEVPGIELVRSVPTIGDTRPGVSVQDVPPGSDNNG